jgi:SDR family mycofactocin-dependent oxidoreductase
MNTGAATRVAIVTGAARGIGAATVAKLMSQGWAVLAVDLATDDPVLPYPMGTRADLDAVVARAANVGGMERIRAVVADVRDRDAMVDAVAEAERVWGGLDAAIACAGAIAGGSRQWDLNVEQEQAMLDINLGGVLSLSRAAIPALLRRPAPRSGRFVAVASAATKGLPMLAAYCAAKAGVAGLIRALGVELADTGVSANAVSPGSTNTPILDESARLYNLASGSDFATQQPMQRVLNAAEIAEVIAFVVSAENSAMTGAVIPVDGGLAL